MLTLLETPSGALSVNSIGERPSRIKDCLAERIPSLIIYPDTDFDLAAELYLPSGERVSAPEEIRAALSYYLFACRGIPKGALAVRVAGRTTELPRLERYFDAFKYSSSTPYRIVESTVLTAGGVECPVATVSADTRSRIIMLECEPDMAFLKGLKVQKGLSDCERAIAARKTESGFSFISTEKLPTLDSALALTAYLNQRGKEGELALTSASAEYHTRSSFDGISAILRFSIADTAHKRIK